MANQTRTPTLEIEDIRDGLRRGVQSWSEATARATGEGDIKYARSCAQITLRLVELVSLADEAANAGSFIMDLHRQYEAERNERLGTLGAHKWGVLLIVIDEIVGELEDRHFVAPA